MIDTIVLTLKEQEFQITQSELFTPNAKFVLNNKNAGLIAKQNPTKKELKNKVYKPYLSLSGRLNDLKFYEPSLKIELSLPKLLFGNNFEELRYKDFSLVVNKLISVLESMGVKVSFNTISNAKISAIHYSKNIVFTDGTIPYHYISKIKQANIKMSLDVNQTDYRNEGHSFKWHCNSYEVVFYDKIKDLEKAKQSGKRAIEKDSLIQLDIFDSFKKKKKLSKLEVLRMEVRLNKRQKIKQLFKKLNIKSSLTFKKLFKPSISKKILLHYLDELENNRPILLDYKSDKALLTDLLLKDLSFRKILQFFGLKKILEIFNERELRNLVKNKSSLSKLLKEANSLKLKRKESDLKVVRDCLVKFKMVKNLREFS